MITIKPPSTLNINIYSLRKLFRKPSTLFKLIVYNPQSDKVKSLTSLCKLIPYDDIKEVVSTDTTSV